MAAHRAFATPADRLALVDRPRVDHPGVIVLACRAVHSSCALRRPGPHTPPRPDRGSAGTVVRRPAPILGGTRGSHAYAGLPTSVSEKSDASATAIRQVNST